MLIVHTCLLWLVGERTAGSRKEIPRNVRERKGSIKETTRRSAKTERRNRKRKDRNRKKKTGRIKGKCLT
jgi:hypothetical protein